MGPDNEENTETKTKTTGIVFHPPAAWMTAASAWRILYIQDNLAATCVTRTLLHEMFSAPADQRQRYKWRRFPARGQKEERFCHFDLLLTYNRL